MDLKHLHLHVRDRIASVAFYSRWFGLAETRRFGDLTFLTDAAEFEFALMEDAQAEPLPSWFHFGFRLEGPQQVVDLCAGMREAGIPIARELYQDASLVSFRCRDPDGVLVEVYWEARESRMPTQRQ